MSSNYQDVIIGLEVHIQLTNLKTKLFCSCNADLALDCKINNSTYFFRKNYFYVDLPKGFQISQYNKAGGKAFADGGKITVKLNGIKKDIILNRIHLEEDPARLVHKGSIATSPYTLVDYNRSGVCLIEIVTEPVITSPEEAREYLKQLKSIIQYTGISDLDLTGAARVDANISIKGHKRSEVKNINSFKEVERALKWEIQRQRHLLKRGKELTQETRHWDDKRRITISLRSKEFEEDYRYFPEQDLVPIAITEDFIQKVNDKLPEMPNERSVRLSRDYNLSEFDSDNLVLDKDIADFYEEGVNLDPSFGLNEFKQFCNWLMNDVSRKLNEENKSLKDTKLHPKQLVDLIHYIKEGKITTKIGKSFIHEMMEGTSISQIIDSKGKKRISNEKILEMNCIEVINENPKIVEDFHTNPKAIEALIGKVMGKTKGQADPGITRKIMNKLLEEEKT
ncbi:MAG: Asp-tRNA(Asn)/Glu-tRNA(Gln) amidotransferase subunit GatB [Promethearchaeota archaeon]